MRTMEQYKQLKIYWTNKWRKNFETFDTTEDDFGLTCYAETLELEVKRISAELKAKTQELQVAKNTFNEVQREREIQARKKELGLSEPVAALLEEVYQRTNESSKLKGNGYGYQHNLPLAYADIRNFVKNGTYGAHADLSNGHKWNPVFVTYRLVQSASQIMYYDTAKKGEHLKERVAVARQEAWKVYNDPDTYNLPFTK